MYLCALTYYYCVHIVVLCVFLHFAYIASQPFKTPVAPEDLPRFMPLALVPNGTEVVRSVSDMVHHMAEGQLKKAQYRFPLSEILQAIATGSPLPTLAPGQDAPLPSLSNDIYCNPAFFANGCTTLDEIGKIIGVPAADWFTASVLGASQRAFGSTLFNLYNRATRGITPVLVAYLQQNQRNQGTVQAARNLLTPLVTIPSDSGIWMAITNLTALLFWDPVLERIDPTDASKKDTVLSTQAMRRAFQCRVFENRLPFCDTVTNHSFVPPVENPFASTPPPQETSLNRTVSTAVDPKTGYRLEIRIDGFVQSCEQVPAKCQIGAMPLSPDQFDGIYYFRGVDDVGFPLYEKPGVKFTQFNAIKSLWLFVPAYVGPIFPQGLSAFITPNAPSYIGTTVQNRNPFALVSGSPPGCKTAASFPLCLSNFTSSALDVLTNTTATDTPTFRNRDAGDFTGWFLVRAVTVGCPVPADGNNGLCELPMNITIT